MKNKILMMSVFGLMLIPTVGLEASTNTSNVVDNYGNVEGNTLTKYYTGGVLTNSTVRDNNGNVLFTYKYHANGKVERKVTYKFGIRTNTNLYNSNGSLTYAYKYHSDGSVKERVKFSNKIRTETIRYTTSGLRTQAYTYHSDGSVKRKVVYNTSGYRSQTIDYNISGLRTAVYSYYSNGKVKQRVKYSSGVRTETVRYETNGNRSYLYTYHSDGSVKRKVTYKSGVRSQTIDYDKSGLRAKVYTYNSDGKVKRVYHYKNGKRNVTYEYNPKNGEIIEKWTYYSNQKVKLNTYYATETKLITEYNTSGIILAVTSYSMDSKAYKVTEYKNGKQQETKSYRADGSLQAIVDPSKPMQIEYYDTNSKLEKIVYLLSVGEDDKCTVKSTEYRCLKVEEYNNWGYKVKTYYERATTTHFELEY